MRVSTKLLDSGTSPDSGVSNDKPQIPDLENESIDKSKQSNNSHSKLKNFNCPYDGCPEKFLKNIRLQTHIRVKHTGYAPFSCPETDCQASFACFSYLQKHLKRHRNNEIKIKDKKNCCQRVYKCTECPNNKDNKGDDEQNQFQKKIQLKIHQAKYHGGQLPFKCNQCEKTFMYRSKLTTHQRRHRGYDCPHRNDNQRECLFKTDKWTELRKHLANEHKRIECSICRKNFSSPYNLRIHEQTVHLEKSMLESDLQSTYFKCTFPDCDKSYTRATSLKNHQRTFHCDEPKYSCEKCSSKFRHKKSLTAHINRNSCEKNQTINKKSKKKSKSITESKLKKILRIKPLIDDKQLIEDPEILDDVNDSGMTLNQKINLEDIVQSNLIENL